MKKYGQTLTYGGSAYNNRKSAEIRHWCDHPAIRQEISQKTRQYVGACKKHLDGLKLINSNRQSSYAGKGSDDEETNKSINKIVRRSHSWYRK
jgi:hypothetical protein